MKTWKGFRTVAKLKSIERLSKDRESLLTHVSTERVACNVILAGYEACLEVPFGVGFVSNWARDTYTAC